MWTLIVMFDPFNDLIMDCSAWLNLFNVFGGAKNQRNYVKDEIFNCNNTKHTKTIISNMKIVVML